MTQWLLVTTEILADIGSAKGAKPLPETMLIYYKQEPTGSCCHERCSASIFWEQFHKKCWWTQPVTLLKYDTFTIISPRGHWVAKWRIYASVNQAIIWTNVGMLFVNWILSSKFQRNFHWNSYIFIQENAFENVVCEMAVILSRPQCVNQSVCGLWRTNTGPWRTPSHII